MTVFVAVGGEKGEGFSILSVHGSKKAAISAAKNRVRHFRGPWEANGVDRWENGCDFIAVEEWVIEED